MQTARIFSISFLFRHQLHSALVHLRQKGGAVGFAVRYLDNEMEDVFSEGRAVLSLSGAIESAVCGPKKLAEALALSTREAIGKHLNDGGSFTVATKISTKKGV